MIQPELQKQLHFTLNLQTGMQHAVDTLAHYDLLELSRKQLRGEKGVAGSIAAIEQLTKQIIKAIDKAIREEDNKMLFWETATQTTERLDAYREQRAELIEQVGGALEAFGFENRVGQNASERSR